MQMTHNKHKEMMFEGNNWHNLHDLMNIFNLKTCDTFYADFSLPSYNCGGDQLLCW